MTTSITIDNLYQGLCTFCTAVTQRPTWRKAGIQAQVEGPYALVYIVHGDSPAQDVVDEVELDPTTDNPETLRQVPRGTTHLELKFEFFRGIAFDAAIKLRNSLQLEIRYWDIWNYLGLCGPITVTDISAIFRQDTEARASLSFTAYANLIPSQLPGQDIFDIISQPITLKWDGLDGMVTTVETTNPPEITAASDSFALFKNTTVTGNLLDNDTGRGLTVSSVVIADVSYNAPFTSAVTYATSHGILAINDNGAFSYTPAPDFVGSDSFVYYAKDELGRLTNAANVDFTIQSTLEPFAVIGCHFWGAREQYLEINLNRESNLIAGVNFDFSSVMTILIDDIEVPISSTWYGGGQQLLVNASSDSPYWGIWPWHSGSEVVVHIFGFQDTFGNVVQETTINITIA